ncbi:class I adenylate-forming enzyme family protein [Nocardiopsis sp. JB363]|uniref:class I adenylate-forming enzyme family protein n=1 Tax=Nocardiopsis sp. JB363 TaxID=1434837 RepID=UPI00097A4F96|nr:class I adenylate-forming enzyme family protein [Nocardiopsis sp. JB363]SIO89845.1 2,3-dihydroxybenzoate-AMP ligase [Nocardiopsis sp. JB363]
MTTAFPDLVPAELRKRWAEQGHYLGRGIHDLFRYTAMAHPDRTAVIDDHGQVTYAALRTQVLKIAGHLLELGVEPGQVVAVQLPNSALAAATELAVAAVGGVCLAFPIDRGPKEVDSLLRRSRATVLVAATEHRGRSPYQAARGLRSGLPELRWLVAADPHTGGPMTVARPVEESDLPVVDPGSAARILVSSGSEAEPKMVAYSHDALAGGRGNFMASLNHGQDTLRAYFLVPLGSAFGSNGTSVTLARHGGTLVLNHRFETERTLSYLDRHRPTHLLGVPTMVRMLLDLADENRPIQPTTLVLGGAPLDAATARRAKTVFGGPVVNLYGSADGVNCHTGLSGDPCDESGPGRPVGVPDPSVVDIRVVDDQLCEVPSGTTGEIIALGPMSPLCYVSDSALDRRYRTPDGWVRTGDLGAFDSQGRLRVVGRLKDVVIRGGANISPVEVEACVRTHPDIADVCCFGVPDPLMGERLSAALVLGSDGVEPSLAELTAYLKEHGLDSHKFPESIVIVGALPLNPAGKVDRDALRRLVG